MNGPSGVGAEAAGVRSDADPGSFSGWYEKGYRACVFCNRYGSREAGRAGCLVAPVSRTPGLHGISVHLGF